MDTTCPFDFRFIILFSLIIGSGALFPGALEGLSGKLLYRWNRFKTTVRSLLARRRSATFRSFWVIDLTRIEP